MKRMKLTCFLILLPTMAFSQSRTDNFIDAMCICFNQEHNISNNCMEKIPNEDRQALEDSLENYLTHVYGISSDIALVFLTGEVLNSKLIKSCPSYFEFVIRQGGMENNAFPKLEESESVAALDSLIINKINLVESLNNRAIHHAAIGQTGLAFKDLHQSISIDSLHYFTYCIKGKIHLKIGEIKDSHESYSRAYDLAKSSKQPMAVRSPLAIITSLLFVESQNND